MCTCEDPCFSCKLTHSFSKQRKEEALDCGKQIRERKQKRPRETRRSDRVYGAGDPPPRGSTRAFALALAARRSARRIATGTHGRSELGIASSLQLQPTPLFRVSSLPHPASKCELRVPLARRKNKINAESNLVPHPLHPSRRVALFPIET